MSQNTSQRTGRGKAPAAASSEASEEASAVAAALAELSAPRGLPIVAALLQLAAALSTLAKFDSTPVPGSLVQRVDDAQAALAMAAADLGANPFGGELTELVGEPFDTAWIRKEFDDLAEGLKTKFTEIDAATSRRFDARDLALAERFDALERATDERFAALKAPVTPDTDQA